VYGHRRRHRRRGDQDGFVVLRYQDAFDPEVRRHLAEDPAAQLALGGSRIEGGLLCHEAHERAEQRNALHPLPAGDVVHPDLRAGLLVGVGTALVHQAVQPAGGAVDGEQLPAADTPARAPVGVVEQRPRLAEAQRLARDVDGVDLASNDTKNQSSPRRTAFSVSGSCCGSKKRAVRVARRRRRRPP